jgi:hypothetical protein
MQLDDDLLRAIGNLALVFAALDLSLAHVLSETSSGKIDFSKACEMGFVAKFWKEATQASTSRLSVNLG